MIMLFSFRKAPDTAGDLETPQVVVGSRRRTPNMPNVEELGKEQGDGGPLDQPPTEVPPVVVHPPEEDQPLMEEEGGEEQPPQPADVVAPQVPVLKSSVADLNPV